MKCPYCGEEETLRKEGSAEDLVKEVSEIMQEAEEE
jgi:hypothetical protein